MSEDSKKNASNAGGHCEGEVEIDEKLKALQKEEKALRQEEKEIRKEEKELIKEEKEHHKKEYHYFVDGKEYTTVDSSLTGAQITSRIPDFNPAYQLVLEGTEGHPDKVIPVNETVDLNVHPVRQFYTVPPATFGRA